MKPLQTAVLMLALMPLASGCFPGVRAADRSLSVHQYMQSGNNVAPFIVDTSAMPVDAVRTTHDGSDISLEIQGKYPVKIMIVPASQP
jgi:hypothetical protein